MRRRHILAATLLPLAVVFASCAPISVSSHLAPDADFSAYHTFAWSAPDTLPIGDARLDNNPIFRDYLLGAVERRLAEHGITLAARTAVPDLLIHYHATVASRVDEPAAQATTNQAPSGPRIVVYDESTIVLDLIDARTQKLVWRGWAQDGLQNVVNDQDAMRAHIEKSVLQMLERLPI